MAKDKKAKRGTGAGPGSACTPAELFQQAAAAAGEIDEPPVVVGLPLRPFSLQWLLMNTGFGLGRMTILIGESGSCKTALQAEMMRWHLRVPGACVLYKETEARDSAVLRRSIIGDADLDRVFAQKCDTIQEWQTGCTDTIKRLRERYDDRSDGPAAPLMLAVDSLTGVTSQQAVDNIEEDGHASLMYAIDANLLNSYMKYIGGQVSKWPMSFVVTNHIKFNMEKRGMHTVKVPRIPGGDALVFHATTILMLKGRGAVERADVDGGFKIEISTFKNSLGVKNQALDVEMNWWYDATTGAQTTVWDWHAASVKLLAKHLQNPSDKAAPAGLGDVIDFPIYHDSARKASCPRLGLRSPVPFSELGLAIADDAALMAALRQVYGIHHTFEYQAGVPWKEQMREAAAVAKAIAAAEPSATPTTDPES